jgi:uracil-DNA glycosylase family 4
MTKLAPPIETIKQDGIIETLDAISGTLKYMAASGCRGFECSPAQLNTIEHLDTLPGAEPANLMGIQSEVRGCERCGLSKTRTQTVFGEGNSRARLVFVGEGPGYEEDQQGRPFVGAAGQLLTKIVQAMGLVREDVYIGNIIKCRPPGNRNPAPDEIEACLPYLERQLKAIQPEYICALGAVAARTLLNTEAPISRLRGRLHSYGTITLMPTFHPAYLLRNPDKKRDVWEDIQVLMREMGLKKPAPEKSED